MSAGGAASGDVGPPFRELRNSRGERLDFAFHAARGAGGSARRGPVGQEGLGPALVIAHGVTSNKDRPYLIALAEAAAARGIAALRFSFAGNGASEGRFDESTPTKEVGDAGSVIDALAAAGFGPIGYAGHSMGAAVGVLRAASDARITALVSLAGMFHVGRFFERQFGQLAFGAPMRGLPQCPWNPALAHDAARLGSLAATASGISIPWLLVHGTADDLVPAADAHDARAAGRGAPDLVELAGVDHRFSGAIPTMVDAVVPWLARALRY